MRFVLVSLVFASVSLAQTNPPQKTVAPKPQNIIFGDDLIEGGVDGPEGQVVYGKSKARFESMIKVRVNFDDKLRESVHEM